MTRDTASGPGTVVGAFPDATRAQQALAALVSAGVSPSAITMAGAPAPRIAARDEPDAPFLGRLVLIVVLWSIIGTPIGVAIAIALNTAGIGPGGTAGLVLMIVGWGIFVHMLAGMWAGYALLTRGESRAPTTARPGGPVLLSVRYASPEQRVTVVTTLREQGARVSPQTP